MVTYVNKKGEREVREKVNEKGDYVRKFWRVKKYEGSLLISIIAGSSQIFPGWEIFDNIMPKKIDEYLILDLIFLKK